MSMTGELLAAIAATLNAAQPVTDAFTGGLWNRLAPTQTAFPYLIFKVVPPANLTEVYGTGRDADIRICFIAVGNDMEAGDGFIEIVTSLLDANTLELQDGATSDISNQKRVTEPIPILLGLDNNVDEIWGWSVDYVYSMHNPGN